MGYELRNRLKPPRRVSAGRYTNERLRNVLLGYARISKADGSQALDLQRDALIEAAVKPDHIYEDQASGKRDDRPGLAACLKALREGDVLVVWKLDRLGRDLRHLVNTVCRISAPAASDCASLLVRAPSSTPRPPAAGWSSASSRPWPSSSAS